MTTHALGSDEYIKTFADHLSQDDDTTLDPSTLRWIARPDGKELISDATLALYIDGIDRNDGSVLLVSNAQYPDTVRDTVKHLHTVKSRLSAATAQSVAAPSFEGVFGSETYACFPRLSPLSDNRLVRRLQKDKAAAMVVDWLIDVANETRHSQAEQGSNEDLFLRPLESLAAENDVNKPMRDLAEKAASDIRQGKMDMWSAVQHGDLWYGNVMFERRRAEQLNPKLGALYVIDWAGAFLDGYPGADLIRFLMSIYDIGSGKIDELVSQYIESVELSRLELATYCVLSLGRLGQDLDQFPKERYCRFCETFMRAIDRHVLTDAVAS